MVVVVAEVVEVEVVQEAAAAMAVVAALPVAMALPVAVVVALVAAVHGQSRAARIEKLVADKSSCVPWMRRQGRRCAFTRPRSASRVVMVTCAATGAVRAVRVCAGRGVFYFFACCLVEHHTLLNANPLPDLAGVTGHPCACAC